MPDEITTPLASWGGVAALLSALGLGGIVTAIIQRPSRRNAEATAAKDEAMGGAAVIASMATAFTGTTGALREEIERMQEMLNDLRQRVAEAEAELRAAAGREAGMGRTIAALKAQLETSHADVIRLRGERDTALDKAELLNGENRQLKQVIASLKREEAAADS